MCLNAGIPQLIKTPHIETRFELQISLCVELPLKDLSVKHRPSDFNKP